MSSAPGHLSQMQVLVVKFPEVATVRKVVNIIKIIIIMITIIIIIRAPFYEYLKLLKATRKGKKSKEGFAVASGNRTGDVPHRRTRTNYLR